jgi:hypothetical protein
VVAQTSGIGRVGYEQTLTILSERFGKSFVEAMTTHFDDLKAKISEADVEKWAGIVDTERRSPSSIDLIKAQLTV